MAFGQTIFHFSFFEIQCHRDARHAMWGVGLPSPAPWRYTGRSYLQLSFMDAAVAKANLPPGLVLDSSLERFGKTYGGFFLLEHAACHDTCNIGNNPPKYFYSCNVSAPIFLAPAKFFGQLPKTLMEGVTAFTESNLVLNIFFSIDNCKIF